MLSVSQLRCCIIPTAREQLRVGKLIEYEDSQCLFKGASVPLLEDLVPAASDLLSGTPLLPDLTRQYVCNVVCVLINFVPAERRVLAGK